MSVVIKKLSVSTPQLLAGLNALLPQLSGSAAALTTAALDELLGSEGLSLFVAFDGENIVGALTLVIFAIPTGHRAWIEDVVVDESSRGLGTGRALLVAATDEAKRRGVRSIDLTSRPARESANSLYLNFGFELRETNLYRLNL